MPASNQTPPWSSFPVETHDPMISLWADLLRRWLASRALQEETPHDHLAQDRAAPLAAASPRLCPAIDTSAAPEQPRKHPPPISACRAGAADGLAGRAGSVIDDDLGLSGTSSDQRGGFQRLVASIGLGEVGIILVTEVSRLSRCNSDWHRVIELCAVFATLIADEDGVYDPSC